MVLIGMHANLQVRGHVRAPNGHVGGALPLQLAPGLEGYDTSFPCFARARDFDRAVGKSSSSYMSRGDYILIKTFLPARDSSTINPMYKVGLTNRPI
jgi:hypothetical protein